MGRGMTSTLVSEHAKSSPTHVDKYQFFNLKYKIVFHKYNCPRANNVAPTLIALNCILEGSE